MYLKHPPPQGVSRQRWPGLVRPSRSWLLAVLGAALGHWAVLGAWDAPRLRQPEARAPGLAVQWMELAPAQAMLPARSLRLNDDPVQALPIRGPRPRPHPASPESKTMGERATLETLPGDTRGGAGNTEGPPAMASPATGPSVGALPHYPTQPPESFALPLAVRRAGRTLPGPPLVSASGSEPAAGIQMTQPQLGHGELRYVLEADGRYRLELALQIEGQATLLMNSQGQVSANGLAPERFTDRRRGQGAAAANFDRDARQARFSGHAATVPLADAAQDRLSWLVQLPAVVRADRGLQRAGAQVLLQVVGARGGAQVWRFESLGQQPVSLPDGQTWPGVWRWLRKAEQPYDLEVELWLDPRQLDPVWVRLTPVPGGRAWEFWPARGVFPAQPVQGEGGDRRP